MAEQITVRKATKSDLDAIARLRAIGFGGQETEIREHVENNPRYGLKDIIMAEINGQVVGTACAFSTQMWLSGVPMDMGAVASVVTDPDHRNKRVSKTMMVHLLQKMVKDGLAISALFPASHAIYQSLNYASAAIWHAYSIKPDNLITTDEKQHVRPFKEDDLRSLQSIYRGSQMSGSDGRLTRTAASWQKLTAEKHRTDNKHIVVYEDSNTNKVEGYLKYKITEENILHVSEMFVSDDAAFRGLWSYMAAQPNITAINYVAPSDAPIVHLLKLPQDSQQGNRGWIFNDVYHATSSFMLRVINVREALLSRFYPYGMMGNRVLKITDPLLPENEEIINFRIVDGRPDMLAVEGKEPDVETDIATFSQILCGFLNPEVAKRLGRLKADEESILWLRKAMTDHTKPLFIHAGDWF